MKCHIADSYGVTDRLHIIIGTVFIVPIIDREEILGRKQFSVFPLA